MSEPDEGATGGKPERPMERAARDLVERMTPDQAEGFRRLAAQLRAPIPELAILPEVRRSPSEEAIATGQVRAEIERLGQITAALLELGVEQSAALEKSRQTAERATRVIIVLTVALVVLTAVLVLLTYGLAAEVFGWWPFGLAE